MTKAYTINRLITEISQLSTTDTTSVKALTTALSPRAGRNSVKLKVLNNYLGGQLRSIVNNSGSKGSKATLLNTLKKRKNS